MFFSQVKYKEDLTWLKGIGCYAYDTPDFTLAEKNKTLYSKVCLLKYKSHLPACNIFQCPQRELVPKKQLFICPSLFCF